MKNRLFTIVLVLFSTAVFAQVITPFSIRYQTTQKGGIRYLSNTSVTCSGVGCGAGRSEVPPAGTSTDNGFTAAYVDIDADGTTFSSSSDSLALPTCSEISWAGLYWGGEMTNAGANYATRNQVKLKTNNGSYVNLTADALQDNAVGFSTYHCYKDITAIMQAGGTNARYTIANVAARIGGTNRFGGWSIVIVYKNDLQPMRNLTVFNGLSNVSGANPISDITVSGFLTPLSGPVTFEVGNITYDGDRSSTGDQLMFNGGSGFVNILDAVNPTNDIFNSTYSYNGVQKVTPFINPGYTNSLGYDADIFLPNNAAKNFIGNSATSATLRLTTGGETFLTQVVTMAIDVYEPDLRAACRVVDLNGGSVLPGDILEYTIVGKNIGSDPSVNTYITDTLEYNSVYIPGSLSILSGPNAGLKTDAAGDDQAEYITASRTVKVRIGTGANAVSGGQVNNSPLGIDSTQIRFRTMATTDCIVLQCDNIINNRAYIFGTGNVSGNNFNNGSNPNIFDGNGCPVPGTTNTPISAASCTPPSSSSNSPVCTGSTLSLTTSPSSSIATYSWTGPGGFVSTAANPNRANATAAMAGTYTCVITIPGSACSFTVTTTVVINTRPATPAPSSNTPVCSGNTINLSTAAVAGATYSWTGPSAFASALQNPTRPAATVAMSGTYSVTVTANGCTSAVGTTVVIVNSTPATPAPSSNTPACTGNTINLSTAAVAGATYSWTGPNSFASAVQNPSIVNATPAMAGTYSVTVTTNGCTSAVGTTAVVVNATPATPAPSSNTPVCTGNTINLSTVAVAGATYSWTGPNSFASAVQNPSIVNATAAMAGTYSLTVTTNGCTSAVGTTVLVINTTPATPAPSSNTPVCTGNTINLSTAAVAGATYSWTGPNSFASAVQNPAIVNATTAMAGTYSVVVTANGCSSAVGTTAVVVNSTPAAPAPSSNSPVCTGNTINLSTAAVAGATYSWTGPAAFVSAVQNPTRAGATAAMAGTYSVTITTNGCTSPVGTVAVVINATPAAPTASSNSPVCTGNTINLSTPVVAGATYSWTGPNSFASAVQNPSIVNATAAMAGTYSVTVTTTGCTSAVGTVAVVVNATPAAPAPSSNSPVCTGNTINLSTTAVAGATYSWTGPNSFVSAVQNPSIVNATAAMAGTYSLTITTTGCTSAVGTIAVIINATPAAPTASSNSPVCSGNTINLSTPAVAGATYSWTGPAAFVSAVQNPTRASATVAMSGTYSVTITTNGCTSAVGTVAVIVNATPSTPAPSSNSPVCIGNTINLSTAAVAGATYSWTGPNSFVSAVQNPSIVNATAAMAGTYSVTVTTNGCISAVGTTVVTITPPPTTAAAGSDQTICVNSTTMAANAPTTGTGTWTQISGPVTTTITTPSSPVTTITGITTAGTYVFQWTISNSPCTASSDLVSVILNGTTAAANAGTNQLLCDVTTTVMAANAAAPGVGSWTQVSGPNTATITSPASETTTMTGLITGIYVFEWTITNAPCPATTDNVTVTISAQPTTSFAGPDQAICSSVASMLANTPSVGAGTWSQVSGPNTATITTPTSPASTMTGLIAGTYVFEWSIANAPCVQSDDVVSIVVSAVPTTANAGTDQTICSASGAATMSGNIPATGTGAWTQVSGPVSATITSPSSEATTITGMTTAGTYVFEWSISNGSCAASNDSVSVIVNNPPTVAAAGNNQSLCNVTTALMNGNTAVNGTGNWTQISGPNTATITTPSSEGTTMTGLIAGTYVFEWTISNSPCAATTSQVQVDIFDLPTTSNAGPDTSICAAAASTTMNANAATTGTGNWSQVSGPSTAAITNPASPVTTVTGMVAAGTYVFQWEISNGVCAVSADSMQVIVADPPTTSSAGADQTLCNSAAATMGANTAGTGTGAWTQISGPNTATITSPAFESTSVTGLIAGTYLFEWTITSGACTPSSDTIQITIDDLPTASNAGADQQICNATAITMAANIPSTGTGMWSQLSGPNTAIISSPSSEATTITGLTSGAYVFVWSITNGVCAVSTDSVNVIVDPLPTTASAGPDQLSICPPVTTMTANVPTEGTGMWSQLSGPNTATITTPNSATTTISSITSGTYDFVWTISSGVCASSADTIQVVVIPCDSDGDGVADLTEVSDGTNPNDPCDYLTASVNLIQGGLWNLADCDGDGVTNGTEITDGTNPNDPCDHLVANITLSQGGNWNTADCDNDGVTNGTEIVDGTNPSDPCDYIAANMTLPQGATWNVADCDGDGVINGTEVADGTNPNNPCDYLTANITLSQGGNWNVADCDGDGVINGTEITDGTNPNNPCEYLAANITLSQGGNWNAADCDGDGVTNGTEIADGTNPNNPCEYLAVNITLSQGGNWNAADCDGDGVINGTEIIDGTNPNNPCDYLTASMTLPQTGNWNVADCDGDGVTNGTEIVDGTNTTDPCDYLTANVTLPQGGNWNTVDCDGDGVTNGTEIVDGTNPNNPCDYLLANVTLTPGGNWNAADCDGDGVINGTEVVDGTNATDPCDYLAANMTLPQTGSWNVADCDGDGVTNGTEVTDGTNTNDPCDYLAANVTLPQGGNWNIVDCDGDGVTNGTEIADGTNPDAPCDLLLASQTLPPNAAWNALDCDADGITNGVEITNGNNPLDPCDPNACDLIIPEGFSPNGDGINDIFEIKGISAYPNNTVTMFNRWGNLVYKAAGYDNGSVSWDATNQGELSTGSGPLPEGTYFYVIDLGDGSPIRSGYVFVNRQ